MALIPISHPAKPSSTPRPRAGAPGEVVAWPQLPVPSLLTRFHRPELDALRLLAFLMVWLSHSLPGEALLAARGVGAPLTWWLLAIKDAGNFGVCVFFFLSAYLITELLRRELEASGTIALPSFYVRRILRIWPLYLGVLAVYALLGLRFHGFRIEPGRLAASVLLAGNWYIAFHPAILTPMRALWSISVEEQFYLGWPLVLKRACRRSVILAASGVFVASIAATLILARTQPREWLHVTAWVNSFVQFQYFALGALTAMLLKGRVLALGLAWRISCAALAVTLALVSAGICRIKRVPAPASLLALPCGYLLVGAACLLLFLAVFGAERSPRAAGELGRISFGLYVFHELGFFLADEACKRTAAFAALEHSHWALALGGNKLLALGCTVPIAWLSYRFWEKPFLRWKDRFTIVRSRLA